MGEDLAVSRLKLISGAGQMSIGGTATTRPDGSRTTRRIASGLGTRVDEWEGEDTEHRSYALNNQRSLPWMGAGTSDGPRDSPNSARRLAMKVDLPGKRGRGSGLRLPQHRSRTGGGAWKSPLAELETDVSAPRPR